MQRRKPRHKPHRAQALEGAVYSYSPLPDAVDLSRKLAILADAAKYDASCASSGTTRRDSLGGRGIGSTDGTGICHSHTPDGRCVSLLKILLTNFCTYDCLYCVNRASSNVPRARFSVDEVVRLTLDFYRRNCIEGLFLSSGIIRSPDYTMEQVVEVARVLREEHDFRGYIHLKTIPEASAELLARAGRYADRLSINVELPTPQGLASLAPEKDAVAIRRSMGRLRLHIDEAREAGRPRAPASQAGIAPTRTPAEPFAPAGQSTQMIVGADTTDDRTILATSARLYGAYRLRRVYYSAFSPIPDAARALPLKAAPLVREHRLYQADWLMRFYGYAHDELAERADGMLALEIDPKLAWALAHPERFPADLNRAPRELLLRVPGLGVQAVDRLLQSRRVRTLRRDDLTRLRVPLKKVLPFVILPDHRPDASEPVRPPIRPPGGAADAAVAAWRDRQPSPHRHAVLDRPAVPDRQASLF
jgi:putative DNA modification/repair radical SAM protein